MKKILSLLAIFMIPVITGCSEDSGGSVGVAPKVTNSVDVSSNPIEVGTVSDGTYTLRIANPFDNATNETKDYATAIVRVKYNNDEITALPIPIGHPITAINNNNNIIFLSSTCGTATGSPNGSYGIIPNELEKGQSCEITYKLAPTSAFVFVDKITIEYFKKSYFIDPNEGINPDMDVLTAEALIEKAKANNAYQLSETVLKFVGKKGEIVGTEENHTFNKNTGALTDGTEYIIETFDAANNDTEYTVNFLNTDSNTSTTIPFKLLQNNIDSETDSKTNTDETIAPKLSPKLDIETQLSTFYTFDFNSNNSRCTAASNPNNKQITVNCSKGGQGELKIGLHIGKDNYYKEKYLKDDKAYYITKTEIEETPVPPIFNSNVYMYLSSNIDTDGTTTIYNAKCWTEADVDSSAGNAFKQNSATDLTATAKTIYYNNTTFPVISAIKQEYVTVTGKCGDDNINMIYPATDFIANGQEPTSPSDFTYSIIVSQGKIMFNINDTIPSISNEESASTAYILLEKMVTNSNQDQNNNMDLNARCWLAEDKFIFNTTNYFGKEPRTIENLELKQYRRNNFSYNSDGTMEINPTDYVLLTGTCGNIELAREYPLSSFTGTNYANYETPNTKPDDNMDSIQLYYLDTQYEEKDGAIRHNLLAR